MNNKFIDPIKSKKMTSNSKRRKNKERQKSFPTELSENANIRKPVLNKLIATHE